MNLKCLHKAERYLCKWSQNVLTLPKNTCINVVKMSLQNRKSTRVDRIKMSSQCRKMRLQMKLICPQKTNKQNKQTKNTRVIESKYPALVFTK